EALDGFKSGKFRILVATDILARGIDVEALEHVVNFDVPATPEDYIHRVGRTGRADLKGDAYTFAAPEEAQLVRDIEKKLGKPIPKKTLADFDYTAASDEPLEIPLHERIAKIRAERQAARQRTAEKEARRNGGNGAAPRSTEEGSAKSAGGNGRRRGRGRAGAGRPAEARNATAQPARNEAPRDTRPADSDDEDRIPAHVDNRDARSRQADQKGRPGGRAGRPGSRSGSGGSGGAGRGGSGGWGRGGSGGGGRGGSGGGGRSGSGGGGRGGRGRGGRGRGGSGRPAS
ncbi:MAG TPA: helicase-related protein, partial [Longimicrobiales bacterium]